MRKLLFELKACLIFVDMISCAIFQVLWINNVVLWRMRLEFIFKLFVGSFFFSLKVIKILNRA